ncbi:nitric oxide dioxygenase [Kushneria sinocarnis]|uniref:nitric oxide dioxygenase n=1 Tax=Kushneria sinocarnis TaxID=595502 RepID=A0A420X148_9GAMM|nr:NO-inducible flavohemoprotein [Kushneria sinocarnis]RKR07429.1 nitric oxide dioxygenase [Kushneria sinocarnis]
MLTESQEAIIADTTPVVADHIDAIARRFYPLLFERYPEVRSLFNVTHQQSGAQPRALAGAVVAYVQLRHDPQRVRRALTTIVDKHVSLNIRPEHYPMVGECLMAAIGEVLGDAVTPAIADAWQALYGELAELLISLEHERYDEFARRPGGWQGARRFRIAERRPESAVITSFVLAPEDGGPVADFAPGQFIGVRLRIEGEIVHRQYSLSASPDGRHYRISIKREEEGRVSRHFHDRMQPGDTLELLPPAGELTLVPGREPVMLLSGGVGQTPMLSLARQALQAGRRVIYLHAARDAESHAFAREVAALAAAYPHQLERVTLYEQGEASDATIRIGRVDRALLAEHLPDEPTRCYFIGPPGFMNAVEQHLAALGVPAARRHHEHFGPSRRLEETVA